MLFKRRAWAIVLATSTLLSGAVVAEDDSVVSGQWYQIDLIVFKPKNTNVNQESWPASQVAYPADVISIFEPGFFKLQQLEQLEPLFDQADQGETTPLKQDEFAFQGRGNQDRSRRIVESVTRPDRPTELTAPTPANTVADTPLALGTESAPAATSQSTAEQVKAALESIPDPLWDAAFARTEDSSSLQSVARSLNRSSRFTLLSHYSWVQPISGTNQPIMIQTGKRYDDQYEVEGTVSLSRSRFLHIDTNLWYTRFEPTGGASNPFRGALNTTLDDKTLAQHSDLVEIERQRGQYYPVQQHLMTQSRRMRSDELHYIDHPLVGLIIRINRYERPQALAEND